MLRKLLSLTLVLCMLMACTLPAAMADEETNLIMWTFLDVNADNGRSKVLKELISRFEKANPGVHIEVQTQEWSTMSAKVIAGHAAGTCPDIFMINAANIGEAIAAGCMEPLENMFYNEWTDEQKADIESELFKAGFDGTYHYEVPLFSGGFGIMYRIDLFEKFGIKVDDIKTWDDLVEVAQKLTFVDENGAQVWGYGIGYSTDVVDPHGVLPSVLYSQEGGMFTEDGKPNDWAGEQGQKGLQFQIDLIDKYHVMPASVIALTSEEIYNQFEAGQYAMVSGGSIRVPTVKSLTAFDPNYVGYFAYPQWNEGQPSSIANGYAWNTGVWSGSTHKDVAGKFLEYLVSAEADELWVRNANQIPVLASTFEKCADVIDTPANSWMKVAQNVFKNSAMVFSGAYSISGYTLDLQNAMINAYSEGNSVIEALEQAAQDFTDRNVGR